MKFEYTGLRVKNLEGSVKFYREVLGMEEITRFRMPKTKGESVWLKGKGGEHILELNYYEPTSPYAAPYEVGEGLDHLGFSVANIDEVYEKLRQRGVEVALEPFEQIGYRFFFVKDPNGIWIEFFQKLG